MQIFKGKEAARTDLQAINGATKISERSPQEFRRGGNGGQDFENFNQLNDDHRLYPVEEGEDTRPVVNLSKLEEQIEDRLPALAERIGALTYGELLQLAVETTNGKLETDFDAMAASDEAQKLAAKLHIWSVQGKNR